MAVNVQLSYPIERNNKISHHSFSLNTKVKNIADINDEFNRRLKIEYPGIDVFPLKLNINRLIYVASQNQLRKNTRKPNITIPKGLSINQRMVRIIYECSGLTKGNSLVWDTYFAREARYWPKSDEYIRTNLIQKYVSDDNQQQQNRQKLISTYLQLLTDLWSFLARVSVSSRVHKPERDNEWFFQSLRRSMIKTRNNESNDKQFIIGELVRRKTATFVPTQFRNLIQYLKEIELNENENDDGGFINISTVDWSKATGGIPLDIARKIHYHLLGLCYSRINSSVPFNNEQDTFKYVAWIRRRRSILHWSSIPETAFLAARSFHVTSGYNLS